NFTWSARPRAKRRRMTAYSRWYGARGRWGGRSFWITPAETLGAPRTNPQEAAMETWATLSITDHRKPIYRQALALFDKIVVPIPSSPIGDQTVEELDQLEAD